MKLNHRSILVQKAHIQLATAICEVVRNNELTHAELTHIIGQELLTWNKWAIRDEREEAEAPKVTVP